MKSIINITVSIIIGFILLGLAGYLIEAVQTQQRVDEITNKVEIEERTNTKTEPAYDISEAKQEFMAGCLLPDGSNRNYCSCVFDLIIDDVGLNKLLDVSLNYTDAQLDAWLSSYVNSCYSKII